MPLQLLQKANVLTGSVVLTHLPPTAGLRPACYHHGQPVLPPAAFQQRHLPRCQAYALLRIRWTTCGPFNTQPALARFCYHCITSILLAYILPSTYIPFSCSSFIHSASTYHAQLTYAHLCLPSLLLPTDDIFYYTLLASCISLVRYSPLRGCHSMILLCHCLIYFLFAFFLPCLLGSIMVVPAALWTYSAPGSRPLAHLRNLHSHSTPCMASSQFHGLGAPCRLY